MKAMNKCLTSNSFSISNVYVGTRKNGTLGNTTFNIIKCLWIFECASKQRLQLH